MAFSADLHDKNEEIENSGVLPTSKVYLHLPSEFARAALIYASYIGHSFCDQTYTVCRNCMDYFMLAVVDSGGMFFRYNGMEFEVHAGETILLDCRLPHTYGAVGGVSFRYIYFRGAAARNITVCLQEKGDILSVRCVLLRYRVRCRVFLHWSQIQPMMNTVFPHNCTAFWLSLRCRMDRRNRFKIPLFCARLHLWSIIFLRNYLLSRLRIK